MGLERKEQQLQVNIRARMGKPQDADAILSLLAVTEPGFAIEDKAQRNFFAYLNETELIRTGCIELQQRDGTWELGAAGVSAFSMKARCKHGYLHQSPISQLSFAKCYSPECRFCSRHLRSAGQCRRRTESVYSGFSYAFPPSSPLVPPLLTRAIEHSFPPIRATSSNADA